MFIITREKSFVMFSHPKIETRFNYCYSQYNSNSLFWLLPTMSFASSHSIAFTKWLISKLPVSPDLGTANNIGQALWNEFLATEEFARVPMHHTIPVEPASILTSKLLRRFSRESSNSDSCTSVMSSLRNKPTIEWKRS